MASISSFWEDNGAAVGSPPRGTTRVQGRSEVNFKNIDDSTTAYSSSPITTGNNSYSKWQFLALTGSFNTISNGKFWHSTGILGNGLTILFTGTSGYSTPSTTSLGATAMNITIPSGTAAASQTILFGTAGPEAANASTVTTSGYTQYCALQMLTTSAASPGDTSTCTFSLSFDES